MTGIPRDPPLALVALLAVLLPLVPARLESRTWHGAKTLVFEIGAVLLLGLLPRLQHRVDGGEGRRPQPAALQFFLLLTLWALASYAVSAPKAFALNGWWQIAGGLVVTHTVAARTRGVDDYALLLDALTAASVVISLAAFALYPSGGVAVAEGTYHDHALLGAALMVLLPFPLAGSLSPRPAPRRSAARAAAVLCAAALLLTQTRSSWLGAAAALPLFGALVLWCKARAPRERRQGRDQRQPLVQAIVYALLGCIALFYAFSSAPDGLLATRARSLLVSVPQGHEESVAWRLRSWHGAWRMFRERPVTGWGVGTYPCRQHAYTAQGEPAEVVAAEGPTIPDEAHNSYLQLAVELGVPGLALWLLTVGAAFFGGLRALPRLPDGGPHQRALIGGLCALAGYAVDAFASPAWQFGEVSVYLWVALGLVLAASTAPAEAFKSGGMPGGFRLPVSVATWGLCGWLIVRLVASAHCLPIPHL